MMNIEITQEFKSSLIPFSRELLELLNLPKETFEFLSETGLPLPGLELNANVTVTSQIYFRLNPMQSVHFQQTVAAQQVYSAARSTTLEQEKTAKGKT